MTERSYNNLKKVFTKHGIFSTFHIPFFSSIGIVKSMRYLNVVYYMVLVVYARDSLFEFVPTDLAQRSSSGHRMRKSGCVCVCLFVRESGARYLHNKFLCPK